MYCIKNATVHDGKGKVFKSDILIDDGKIKKIAKNIKCDCECFDAKDKHVFPGFIDPMSSWGILGPGREIRGNAEDNDEHTDVITPEMNIIYAFNGRGINIQQLGAFGITSVGVAPSSNNLFGGLMACFDVDGINPYKMCIKEKAALKACVSESVIKYWGSKNIMPQTHMGVFQMFNEQLRKASEYDGKKKDYKLEALKLVTDGKIPLFVVAKTPQEVHSVLHISKDYKYKLVLASGCGLQDSEEELLKQKPAIISKMRSDDFDIDQKKGDEKFIYNLYKKGLLVGLATDVDGRMCTREDLLWNALEMYKVSKDAEACISMLTYNNAKILGIDDVTGSIEEGKRADIVIYSDHPIKKYDAVLELTLMKGKPIYKKGDAMKCFI